MTESARRGRPPRVTRADIAAAVLDVGFADLTFAAVRERLGVGETTLYRHAPDRDELVRIGLERALSDVAWPELSGVWQEMLRAYGHAAWDALAAHPGSATEVARGVVPAAMAELFTRVGEALVRAGFTEAHAVLAGDLVFDLATDNRRGVEHLDALVPASGPGRAGIGQRWSAGTEASSSTTPELLAQVQAAIVSDPAQWFAAKLDVVLAGIAVSIGPGR